MQNKDYENKKRECWEEFCDEHLFDPHNIVTQGIFGYAFDRAFALGKQEKDTEDFVIQGWVCRDKVINEPFTSDLFLAFDMPTRIEEWGKWGDMGDYVELDSNLFPDLTWESAPEPVEIIIKRKNK